MYGGVITPWAVRNNGIPRNCPDYRRNSAEDLRQLFASMRQAQVKKAEGRGMHATFQEPFRVGDIVNARATDVEIQKTISIGRWTARGVVHNVCMANPLYYQIQWITVGLGTKSRSQPGQISRPMFGGSLRHVDPDGRRTEAEVLHSADGTILVTEACMPDADAPDVAISNYVYLDGSWSGILYSAPTAELAATKRSSYAQWAAKQLAEEEEERIREEGLTKPRRRPTAQAKAKKVCARTSGKAKKKDGEEPVYTESEEGTSDSEAPHIDGPDSGGKEG